MSAGDDRRRLDRELDALEAMLPAWRGHLRHEALFWPQFAALAWRIAADAAFEDLPHARARLLAMLAAQGLPRVAPTAGLPPRDEDRAC